MNRPFLFCVFQRAIRESPLQNTNILMRTSQTRCLFYWCVANTLARGAKCGLEPPLREGMNALLFHGVVRSVGASAAHQNKNGTRLGAIFVLVRARGLELSRTHARRAPRTFSCGFKSRILRCKTEKFGIGSRNQLPSQQKENPHPNGHGFPFRGAGKRT